jgi:type IV pilus assembly protein PilX
MRRRCIPSRQRGVVLFISLIVLVAMTLAGIALVRSVDTSIVISGNLAFKQAATQSTDRGVREAVTWINANSGGATLQNDQPASGYFSSTNAVDPDWSDMANWVNSFVVDGGAPDATGNVARYIIHRMCSQPNTAYNGANAGVNNQCALSVSTSAAASGGSMGVGSATFTPTPNIYYRATVRVDGPRNTISVVQVTLLLPI